jgi:hypothetical protein
MPGSEVAVVTSHRFPFSDNGIQENDGDPILGQCGSQVLVSGKELWEEQQ